MLAHVTTAALRGVDALPVRVEVSLTSGLPAFAVVGLPQSEVREGRERVVAALRHLGVGLPPRRITVNLSPADVRKEGSGFDLPLAAVLLVAAGEIPRERAAEWAFVGEVGLDGSIRAARGVLPRVLALAGTEVRGIVVPTANHREASAVEGVRVEAAPSLEALVESLTSDRWPDPPARRPTTETRPPDLAEVRGQALARRALEVSAAGGHNLLLVGPPGCGKTLLARTMPGLLPPLSEARALEVTRIHSVAGLLPEGCGLLRRPPFRAPHHGVSQAGLVGGGRPLRPGEFSLAHHGVLFLDGLPEFRRDALEALRQPMEEGRVRLTRAHGTFTMPARPLVLGAMNPCPCGQLGATEERCGCTPDRVARYRDRVSGPLVDRFDLHVVARAVPLSALAGPAGESTARVRDRVRAARTAQRLRMAGERFDTNAEMDIAALRRHVPVGSATAALVQRAHDRLGFSARGYHRVLRVARTIADLAGSGSVRPEHAAEALQFRELDRPVPAWPRGAVRSLAGARRPVEVRCWTHARARVVALLERSRPALPNPHPTGPMAPHYLDFAATSAVRPPEVVEAVRAYLSDCGATPGRGGYRRSVEAGRRVLAARRGVHAVLGLPGDATRVTFSPNATTSINHVLHRTLRPGDAVVVTDFDHNAVLRPAAWLERHREVQVRHVLGRPDGSLDRRAFERALEGAGLVCLNAVSNVLGTRLPVAELVREAHAAGALVMVDSAQAAGHVPMDWGGADFVVFTGHKGLLGPQGTGGLWVRPGVDLEAFVQGGTGGRSLDREMPTAWPDHLEAGTANGPGLAGLAAGTAWVLDRGVAGLHAKTRRLKARLRDGLAQVPTIDVLSPPALDGAGIVTVRSTALDGAALARELDREADVQVRPGLHCAPEVHRLLGTTASGAVRFSLGWSSTDEDVDAAVEGTARAVRAVSVSI